MGNEEEVIMSLDKVSGKQQLFSGKFPNIDQLIGWSSNLIF